MREPWTSSAEIMQEVMSNLYLTYLPNHTRRRLKQARGSQNKTKQETETKPRFKHVVDALPPKPSFTVVVHETASAKTVKALLKRGLSIATPATQQGPSYHAIGFRGP